MKLVLIRPGETEFQCQGRIQGNLDIPLTPAGLLEMQRLTGELRALKLKTLFHSPCQSARQAAELIGTALGVKVKELTELVNLDPGLWKGQKIEELRRTQPRVFRQWQEQPESVRPPEGETISEARRRVQAVLARLYKKFNGSMIGLVAPEPLASLCRGETAELGDLWDATLDHGTWEFVDFPAAAVPQAP